MREKNKLKRQELLPLVLFGVAPALCSIIQMIFDGVSVTQVGVMISIITICLMLQNNQVLTDALTGLNNRRGFDNYLEEYVIHHTDSELTIMMIDLNKFKQVNDILGHMMGDFALQDTADTLKYACKEIPGRLFLCRYGGDEFIIAGINVAKEHIHTLITTIHEELDKKTKQRDQSYVLSVSIGVATGICMDTEDAEHLIRVADEAMYDDKKKSSRGYREEGKKNNNK